MEIIYDKKNGKTENGIDDQYPDIFQDVKKDPDDDNGDNDQYKEVI
jgi:hypothetical protein